MQYESSGLGVSAAYDFLAKDSTRKTALLTIPEAISSAEVLRFSPIAFSRTVSGVSCLLADPKYRRGTCYPMYHGGLACSETLTLPALTSLPASAGLPTSWSAFVSM